MSVPRLGYRSAELSGLAIALLVAVVSYWCVRHYLFDFGVVSPGLQLVLLGATVAASWPLRNEHFSRGAVLVLRGLVGLWVFYVVWRSVGFDFAGGVSTTTGWAWFALAASPIIVLACAIGAWMRPALAIPVFVLSLWQFRQIEISSGLPIKTTVDFWVTIEVPIFFLVLTLAVLAVRRLLRAESKPLTDETKSLIFLAALAVHLGNYFYAGLGKLMLAAPWTWMVENPTADLMLGAAAQGITPMLLAPDLLQSVYDALGFTGVGLNVWVLAIQLFGLVAVWRRSWLLAALVMYDILHVGIYLLTGIMFWKWIVLNTLAIAAIRLDAYPARASARGAMIGLVALSTLIFNVTWLAWFDNRAVNVFSVHAEVDRNGSPHLVRVPSSYFGAHSFNFAMNWHYRPGGLFPTSHLGVSFDYDAFRRGRACELDPSSAVSDWTVPEHVKSFVVGHHERSIRSWETHDGWRFDRDPHHIWSMPSAFAEFYELDPRDVRAYRLTVDARCLELADGQVQGPTLATHTTRIPL